MFLKPKRPLEKRLRFFFRANPKRRAEKQRRDWIATSISILALSISAATLYFNNFRQFDELTAVFSVSSDDFPNLTLQEPSLKPGDTLTVTLVNTGNRPLAVLDLKMDFRQLYQIKGQIRYPVGEIVKNSCEGEFNTASLDFVPSVLKPAEIQVAHPKIGKLLDFAPAQGANRRRSFQLCVEYHVALSDGTLVYQSRPALAIEVSRDDQGQVSTIEKAVPISPQIVVHQWRF